MGYMSFWTIKNNICIIVTYDLKRWSVFVEIEKKCWSFVLVHWQKEADIITWATLTKKKPLENINKTKINRK